jgi:ABC-type transport system substrate-binding protein
MDRVEYNNLTDATAIEAAYRAKQIDVSGFPLSKLQVQGIQSDFADHIQNQVAFGFTIQTGWFNFSDWPGSDGLGNPYLDRRFAMAVQMATDRFQMIDTVYLGDGRPSVNGFTPWFDTAWGPSEEELLTWAGWRPDRDQDIAELRGLIEASGYDTGRGLELIIPDLWEGTYPSITETTQAMFSNAMGFDVTFDVQPYTVVLQRLEDGTYPGSGPQWGNPPSNLDPSNGWSNGLLPGGSSNFPSWNYDFQPVTDLVTAMLTELDVDARKDMATQVTRILVGQDPEHGLEGIQNFWGVMNGIQRTIAWPYVHTGEDVFQFAHASHRHDDTWLDTNHPEFPA